MNHQYYSSGGIARELGLPIHRVDYVIQSRRLKPSIVVGGRKLYVRQVLDRVNAEIQQIDSERRASRDE